MTDVEFRDLSGMAEFRAAEALQTAVWGVGDTPDPADLMMVIQAEGGLVGGAFLDGRLVGYVFGFPTVTPAVQHSHRLAVLPDMRGHGLGARLKWYQRDWCLARGIRHVRWTFDPLRSLNAMLNIDCLGARCRTYYTDYYGEMGGINEGLPSDRLLADWRLDDPAVMARRDGRPHARPAGDHLRLPLPPDGDEALSPGRAVLRDGLLQAFADGYEIVAFDGTEKAYLLQRVDEPSV